MAKISQELADTMLKEENPLNTVRCGAVVSSEQCGGRR
jgi:hypothetical protein